MSRRCCGARWSAARARGSRSPTRSIAFLAVRSGGDARTALNALELAIATAQRAQEPRVTLGDAEDSLQRKAVLYDKAGDQHYDYISAWIKSTRGSDPDASLYYLAAMIEGGEDPRFIARRMIVLASEDIGNADPQALVIAVAAAHAVEHVGLPRGGVRAHPGGDLPVAGAEVRRRQARDRRGPRPHPRAGAKPPPAPLRSAAYPAARKLGRGKGYDYPHNHPGHVNDQEHLPEGLEDLRFYFPDEGEPEAKARLERDPEGARPGLVSGARSATPQPLWALVPTAARARCSVRRRRQSAHSARA